MKLASLNFVLVLVTSSGLSTGAMASSGPRASYPLSGTFTVENADCNGEYNFELHSIVVIASNSQSILIKKIITNVPEAGATPENPAYQLIANLKVGDQLFVPNAGGPSVRNVGFYANHNTLFQVAQAEGGGSALNDLSIIDFVQKTDDGLTFTSFDSTCVLKAVR